MFYNMLLNWLGFKDAVNNIGMYMYMYHCVSVLLWNFVRA